MALRKQPKPAVKALEPAAPPVVEPTPASKEPARKVQLRALCGMDRREPYTGQHFPAGVAVEVDHITSWLQCQLDAKIMEIVQ